MIRLSAAAGRNWLCTSRADCSSADRVLEYRSNQAMLVSRKTSVQRSVGYSCGEWLVANYDKNLTRSVPETRLWEVMTVRFVNQRCARGTLLARKIA